MSDFARHAEEYLRLRHTLGHKLADAVRFLPRFVAHLDATGGIEDHRRGSAGVGAAARGLSADQLGVVPAHGGGARLRPPHVRHRPCHRVPPLGLVTFRPAWRPPFIYSEADVEALMAEVPRLVPSPLRAATFGTMIGLLAMSGMRVGEVIALARGDIDWTESVAVVRSSKFRKSREVPLHPTTIEALTEYAARRDRWVPIPKSPTFFCSSRGTAVIYTDFGYAFRRLVARVGIGAESPVSTRVHDLRHTFAVRTLVRWYRDGEDVGSLLPRLSTVSGT